MEEAFKFKLLVEGNEDKHVIKALWGSFELPIVFDMIDCKSITRLLDNLKIRLTIPQDNQIIGIVVDADVDSSSRWDAIRHRLLETGKYDCKDLTLPEDGLILHSNDPEYATVGVWIMPNNKLPGMLEDFVAMLAEQDDVLMVRSDKVLTEIESEGINKYKKVHRSKAKIHTYLAWQDEPGKPMGLSITTRVLKADNPIGRTFIEWLKKLYL